MDHFEQGLKGSIRSMIAGYTFDHFQDMYQRAVKIARVLEESENESRALSQAKRKMEPFRGGFREERYKQFRPNYPQGKGQQPTSWQDRPFCEKCRKHHDGACEVSKIWCYGCKELGHKVSDCSKIAWNQI